MGEDGDEDALSDVEFHCIVTSLASALFLVNLLPKTDIVQEMEFALNNCFLILKDAMDHEREFSDRYLNDIITRNVELMEWVEVRLEDTKKKKKLEKKKKKSED